MSAQTPHSEPTKTPIEELLEEVRSLREDFNYARTVSGRQWLIIGLVVLALLGVGYGQWQQHQNQVTACKGNNERLQAEREFWEDLVIGSDAETKEEGEILKRLDDQAHAVYAPRDCDRLDIQFEAPERMGDITP